MEAPCKDCPKKGCGSYHDQCPDFIEYKKEREKIYEARKLRIKQETDINYMTVRRIAKAKNSSRPKQR